MKETQSTSGHADHGGEADSSGLIRLQLTVWAQLL